MMGKRNNIICSEMLNLWIKEKSVQADSIYFDELTEQYYFKGNRFKSLDSTKTQTIIYEIHRH